MKQLLQISKLTQFDVVPDSHFPSIGHCNKKPNLTFKHWQGEKHLCLDATVTSVQGRNVIFRFQGMATGTSNMCNLKNLLAIPHIVRI